MICYFLLSLHFMFLHSAHLYPIIHTFRVTQIASFVLCIGGAYSYEQLGPMTPSSFHQPKNVPNFFKSCWLHYSRQVLCCTEVCQKHPALHKALNDVQCNVTTSCHSYLVPCCVMGGRNTCRTGLCFCLYFASFPKHV